MMAFGGCRDSAAAARLKAFAGRAALAGDVRDANLSTGERLKRLAITETFLANDFVLYLMVDKASAECQYWAYAEKGDTGHEFVFAFGRGNLKSGMRISDCAVVNIDGFDDLRFDRGGEMEDTGQEVRLTKRLDDAAFSSRISELSGDAGSHKRTTFAGVLKQLTDDEAPHGEGTADAAAVPKAAAPASAVRKPRDPAGGAKRRSASQPADDDAEDEADHDGEES